MAAPPGPRYAPPFLLVGVHVAIGVAGMVAFAAALVVAAPGLAGFYVQPRVLALTHLCVLGWLMPITLGALHQLVPVVFELPANAPKKELSLAVFSVPASRPKKELFPAVVLNRPALSPKNELPLPVVFDAPASRPANTPATVARLRAWFTPILNCVVALTMFPDSVPPAVPSPEILKLLETCGEVVF